MCNLYRMTRSAREVADWFGARDAAQGANVGDEVYPGYPGLVVAEGEVRRMTWGFPLVLTGKQGQALKPRPVNNARTDKLSTFFWRASFERRRCLIPLDAWAEAQGPKGAMTRTWLSVPGEPLIAVAGLWRRCEEWGEAYAMAMTDSAGSEAAAVHSRMPVILSRGDCARWLSGSPGEALALCRPWPGALTIDQTSQSWAGAGGAPLV